MSQNLDSDREDNPLLGQTSQNIPSHSSISTDMPDQDNLQVETVQLTSLPSQRQAKDTTIVTALFVVILIIGSSLFANITYNNHQGTMNADATASAHELAHAQATLVAHLQQTAIIQTPIAQTAVAQTAVASTYPFSANLILNDPLTNNNKGANWDNDGKFCFFSGNAYHDYDDQTNSYAPCFENSFNYNNFTFEAQMVISKGDNQAGGGLIFRADATNNKFYRLYVDAQGNYAVLLSVDSTGANTQTLKSGVASMFKTGLGSTNTLSIVAQGSNFSFYVNHQLVTPFVDSTYSQGQIGFTTENTDSKDTEALFTNVKVWKL